MKFLMHQNIGAFDLRVSDGSSLVLRRASGDGLENATYFVDDLKSRRSAFADVVFPDNFINRYFMALNWENEKELLVFQQNFGMIRSNKFERSSLSSMEKLYRLSEYWDELRGCNLSCMMDERRRAEESGVFCPGVSFLEASECVRNLQMEIEATIEVKNGSRDLLNTSRAHHFVERAGKIIGGRLPQFELTFEPNDKKPVTVSLMDYIVLKHAESLVEDRRFWKCDECGIFFQYKRREATKNQGSGRYCSEKCQAAAKSKRQNQRKREARKAAEDAANSAR